MKLNKDFLVHVSGGETVLVPTGNAGFSGVVRGNQAVGAILECLKNDTSESDIVRTLREQFDSSPGEIEKDVRKVLADLRSIGAIDE